MKIVSRKLLCIAILILGLTGCGSNKYSLEEIVGSFNSRQEIKDYEEVGTKIKAGAVEKNIVISYEMPKYPQYNTELVCELNKNVLSFVAEGPTQALLGEMLTDSVQVLNGSKEGEIYSTINSDEIENYSLAKEGIKIEKIDENKVKVEFDINKKIPLVDYSNTYIEKNDLTEVKSFLKKGSISKGKGNIRISASTSDDVCKIEISEKSALTANAYKSLLSIIETIFESSEVVQYFEKNYSDFSKGDYQSDSFTVEKLGLEDGTETVEVTINKDIINKQFKLN